MLGFKKKSKEDLRKIGNRWSYTFGNNTTLHLYSKPDKKTKKALRSTFAKYTPSKSKKHMSKTFGKYQSLHHIIQGDKKAPRGKYMAFRSRQVNKKTGAKRQMIITTKGLFKD